MRSLAQTEQQTDRRTHRWTGIPTATKILGIHESFTRVARKTRPRWLRSGLVVVAVVVAVVCAGCWCWCVTVLVAVCVPVRRATDLFPFLVVHRLSLIVHRLSAIVLRPSLCPIPLCPMPSYTLQTPQGSFRAFAPLIAAEYNGIDVKVADFQPASSPTGKAPVLILPNGTPLFSSHAISRFVAGLRRDTGLIGASLQDQASVDAWMDFASHELELPACVWFYPAAGYMPFNKQA